MVSGDRAKAREMIKDHDGQAIEIASEQVADGLAKGNLESALERDHVLRELKRMAKEEDD